MKTKPINIHSKISELLLTQGKYHVLILGGWLVEENGFAVCLANKQSKVKITISRAKRPFQTLELGKRAKCYFDFEISEEGLFEVSFKNQNSLKVKKSNLIFFSSFFKYVDNKSLCVLIVKE